MSYWTSLGNFNILKKKIKKKEKEKKNPNLYSVPTAHPGRSVWLYPLCSCRCCSSVFDFNIATCFAAGSVVPVP